MIDGLLEHVEEQRELDLLEPFLLRQIENGLLWMQEQVEPPPSAPTPTPTPTPEGS